MSRPIFFTHRKTIARSDVHVRLFDRQRKATDFELSVSLDDYDLPGDAQVVVEAYHNTYYRRFDWGTVSSVRPARQELVDLTPQDRPLFRVKVIGDASDDGRLLAAIDEVRPEAPEDEGSSSSIFPIRWKTRQEMRHVFWLVQFVEGSELQPELWMNKDVPGLYQQIRDRDCMITGLILPAALREVFRRLVELEDTMWTDAGTAGVWFRFAESLGAEAFADESTAADRRRWVESVVDLFAAKYLFLDQAIRSRQEG